MERTSSRVGVASAEVQQSRAFHGAPLRHQRILSGTRANGVQTDTMVPVDSIQIRPAHLSDLDQLVALCEALWPESSGEEHAQELGPILGDKAALTTPLIIFVAEADAGTL